MFVETLPEKAETETSEKIMNEPQKSGSDDSHSSEEERRKDISDKKKAKKERARKQKESKAKKEDKESKSENTVEDIGFTVQVQPPTGSPFDLQVRMLYIYSSYMLNPDLPSCFLSSKPLCEESTA